MSRAYRLRVRETLRRVIRAEDCVSSQLELLEILPAEQMAELLADELVRRGFERDKGRLTRRDGPVVVTVELATGTVTAAAQSSQEVEITTERTGWFDADLPGGRRHMERDLRDRLKREMSEEARKQAAGKEGELQRQVTDRLEAALGEIRGELDQAVNRATAEALKQKAAQIGQIKQMTEDPQTGSLTIVVEV